MEKSQSKRTKRLWYVMDISSGAYLTGRLVGRRAEFRHGIQNAQGYRCLSAAGAYIEEFGIDPLTVRIRREAV